MNRKEYLKKYYLDNKEKYNAQSKKFYESNRNRCLMLNEEWRIINKDYIKNYKRQWYLKKRKKEAEVGMLLSVDQDLVNKSCEDIMNGARKKEEI
tara:strand:+ start:204 stop:488 length:285 start_codon:yes stop_codon:yes gene_type:complete